MDERDLSAELSFAHTLADLAATVTLSRFGERVSGAWKPDGTVVTEADIEAELLIRDALRAAFPDDGMVGEEGGRAEGRNGRTWVIDPIDGTAHYADGVPLWATLIGLEVDGVVTVGVADMPALGVRYHAMRGGGAWCGDRRLRASEVAALSDAVVLHSAVEEWSSDDRLGDLARVVGAARRSRGLSDAWAHLLIAQGSAEVLLEHEPCFEWDWTATSVILEEAGGRLTTLEGDRPVAGEGLLASNGRVHAEALAVLRAPATP